MKCLVLKFLPEYEELNEIMGNRIWKCIQCSVTSIWRNGHKVFKKCQNLSFFELSGIYPITLYTGHFECKQSFSPAIQSDKKPYELFLSKDLGVDSMEFPVIRAFQQDQTLHIGKKVDVILDL